MFFCVTVFAMNIVCMLVHIRACVRVCVICMLVYGIIVIVMEIVESSSVTVHHHCNSTTKCIDVYLGGRNLKIMYAVASTHARIHARTLTHTHPALFTC